MATLAPTLATRAALLAAAVALAACGSDGGAEDTGPAPPAAGVPLDDPVGAGAGDAAGVDAAPSPVDTLGAPGAPEVSVPSDADDVPAAVQAAPDPAMDANEDEVVDVAEPNDVGTAPGDGADAVTRIGLLAVVRGDPDDENIAAVFQEIDAADALGDALDGALPSPDTCLFESVADGGFLSGLGIDVPNPGNPDLTLLSAGEAIVVSGPDGTFTTLQRLALAGLTVYLPEGGAVPGPIPSGLTVDIPGDEFPGFAGVAVPDAPPLTGLLPADPAAVTAGSTFGWDAGNDPDVRVLVELGIAGTDPPVTVSCFAADDGEFRLPASLLARVPADRSATASLSRLGLRTLREGDALLVVASGSGAVAGAFAAGAAEPAR